MSQHTVSQHTESQHTDPYRSPGAEDVHAAPRPGFAAETIVARPVHPFQPARTPVPTWAKVLIVLGSVFLGFVVLGVLAAVAIPVFLDQRDQAADLAVEQDLAAVGQAESSYFVDSGTYTADPAELGVEEPRSDIAVLVADTTGLCLAGRSADGEGSLWYYTPDGGLSRTPCA